MSHWMSSCWISGFMVTSTTPVPWPGWHGLTCGLALSGNLKNGRNSKDEAKSMSQRDTLSNNWRGKNANPKKNEGLTVPGIMQEEGKRHLLLGWQKSAQQRAAGEMSILTAHSLPWGILFFSKQKVQVQALLPKFLSEMFPSQAGDPKSLSEQLEQSFASGAVFNWKAQICPLQTLRKFGWEWKCNGQHLPLFWQVSCKQRSYFTHFNSLGPQMETVSLTDTVQ